MNHLLTASVPLNLWLVAVQGRVNDDRTSQTHGLTLSSKRHTKLINNVSLEGDAILRHWAIYRQSVRQPSQTSGKTTVFKSSGRPKHCTVKKTEHYHIISTEKNPKTWKISKTFPARQKKVDKRTRITRVRIKDNKQRQEWFWNFSTVLTERTGRNMATCCHAINSEAQQTRENIQYSVVSVVELVENTIRIFIYAYFKTFKIYARVNDDL